MGKGVEETGAAFVSGIETGQQPKPRVIIIIIIIIIK
jgi:hypothetical protein